MKSLQELEQKYKELGQEIERLKKSEYPIYCRSKESNSVVKFNSLKEGIYVKQSSYMEVGYRSDSLIEHTDTGIWEQLEVCPKTGFYDGQLVWCWDNEDTHQRALRFYDAKKKITFGFDGSRSGSKWDNYKPYEGNWSEWAQEAFKTLEG